MPIDHLFISWNFGAAGVRSGERLLRSCEVLDDSDFSKAGILAGYGSVRLLRNDPRFPVLITALREAGQQPRPRFDREYTKAELDRAEFVILRSRTVGIEGGANSELQRWDRARACTECGAGARPRPPLFVKTSDMKSKKLEFTAHDGHWVARADIAEPLLSDGLRGIAAKPVRSLSGLDERFAWLQVRHSWPPVQRPELLFRDSPCGTCGRAGHFDAWDRPTAFVYASIPRRTPDFGVTHEYFGEWRLRNRRPDRRVGGHPRLIVSQKARRALLKLKIPQLQFEPVFRSDDPILTDWPTSPLP